MGLFRKRPSAKLIGNGSWKYQAAPLKRPDAKLLRERDQVRSCSAKETGCEAARKHVQFTLNSSLCY